MSEQLDFFTRVTFWLPGEDAAGPSEKLEVCVFELAVKDIRAMLAGESVTPAEPPTALDVALWGMDPLSAIDISPADVYRFTDLKPDASERMTISQRKHLVKMIREVNADFFGLVGMWPAVVDELIKRMTPDPPLEPLSTTSSDQFQA